MNKNILFIGIFIIMLFSIKSALAVPGIPHQFWGTVTYRGEPAMNGLEVSAQIDGVEVAFTLTRDGSYGSSPNIFYIADPNSERAGETIAFFVNNIDTGQTVTFTNGGHTNLDFSVTGSELTDADGDGWIDEGDNCPSIYNPYQEDMDEDGIGNICDGDKDGDGYSCNPIVEGCYDDDQTESFDCDDLDSNSYPGNIEDCDNKDNDCDGLIDEDPNNNENYNLTQSCYTGPEGTEGIGICHAGTQTCENGAWSETCEEEQIPIDEISNNGIDENCDGADATTTTGGGSSGGGGGGSGSAAVKEVTSACIEKWTCTEWRECSEDGIQVRTCFDENNCGTTENKPIDVQGCKYTKSEKSEDETTEEETEEETTPTGMGVITGAAIGTITGIRDILGKKLVLISLIIVLALLSIFKFVFKRKSFEKK